MERRSSAGIVRRLKGRAAGFLVALAAGAAIALPCAATPNPNEPATGATARFGAYLAGRRAQQGRDYGAAATFFERALRADPTSPELISRTFLMAVANGQFDRARALAEKQLQLDPSDAVADLVVIVDRMEAGDMPGVLARAEAFPQGGVHRFARPLLLAWARMANGDLAGAVTALQEFDKFDGFSPLKLFQLALLYDFNGQADKAEANYKSALAAAGKVNWRLADAMANFYERHGQPDEARKLYRRFAEENSGSELAEIALAQKPAGPPPPLLTSAKDGLAEALFDLASVVNQPETIDLSLLYDRFALELRPKSPLALLLLSDILSAEKQPQGSLDMLQQIPADSMYSWSARLRAAVDLNTLGRTDEAITQLKQMAAAHPNWASASIQLGDLYREKKQFAAAAAAYDEAVGRLEKGGIQPRWSLFYSRGIAFERSGQWQRAEADLLHALKLQPDQPLVLNYLGYSWVDRGENLERGLKMIEKAVSLRPDDGYIVDSLGWAHYRLGDYKEAVKYLEKATELVPEDPTINDHLGDAYWQTGRPREARFQWRQALQFGPAKDDVKPIEAKLDKGLVTATPRRGG
jgi:tetratricopeptide (TPR) repeat protein